MSENLIRTNVPGLYKDPITHAFINTNEYVKHDKQAAKINEKEIINLKNEVGSLKNEISDIKQLLLQLVNGKNE